MACADIRDSLRTNLNEFRLLKREKVLSCKRKAIQDDLNIGRVITNSDVALLGNKLKTKSAVHVEDLALLKLAFVQNVINVVTFLRIKGALHSLVRELSSSKSKHQLVAAECCCNLALGDEKSCMQVAKAAGPYLIAMLSGSSNNLINVSVWTLGNLMGSGIKTWAIVHSQGFLKKLLQLIQEHDIIPDTQTKAEIQQNLFVALVQVLYMGSKFLTTEEVQSIAMTVGNLSAISVKGVRVAEFLLSCMHAAEQELIKNKVHLKCLQFLQNTKLIEETYDSFTPAIRTVANLVAELSGACSFDVFHNWNLLQEVVQKIFVSPYKYLIEEVGWLLGNLMNHPSPEVQLAIQEFSLDFQIFESQYAFFKNC